MRRLFVFVFMLLNLAGANQAEAAPQAALQCEIDPELSREWKSLEPARPNMIALWLGWNTAKEERPKALSLGDDKAAHCYLGCRIAQDAGEKAALYAGWYKEWTDLTDCNSRTAFDPEDEIATKEGALAAREFRRPEDCVQFCR